jgi:hypothetical protein
MTAAKLYQKLKAGEISKNTFLYEVRRDSNLPWITNVTSYGDAIKILKNKGIISEGATMAPMQHGQGTPNQEGDAYSSNAEVNEVTKDSSEEDIDIWMNMFEDEIEELGLSPQDQEMISRAMDHIDIVDQYGMMKPEYAAAAFVSDLGDFELDLKEDDYNDEWTNKRVQYKGKTATVIGAGDGKLDLQFDDVKRTVTHDVPEAEVKIIDSLNEAHELTTAQIIDRLNPYEFKRGVEYEISKLKVLDNISYEKAKEKVAKRMQKDPLAYRYTQLANAKQVEKDDKRLEMKSVKGGNFVDKENGMKKIKGHADEKKNTSTPKKENRKGKPKGVKQMKHETKETVLNEMANFFKKKDSLKENDGTVSGMQPQERTDLRKGHQCITPDGPGQVTDRNGSIVSVQLEDGSERDYTLNVLDAAKDKHSQDQAAKDKAERDQMWSDWDKRGEKTFGGELPYPKTDIHDLLKKLKTLAEKLKLKKESGVEIKPAGGSPKYVKTSDAANAERELKAAGITNYTKKVVG